MSVEAENRNVETEHRQGGQETKGEANMQCYIFSERCQELRDDAGHSEDLEVKTTRAGSKPVLCHFSQMQNKPSSAGLNTQSKLSVPVRARGS